MQEIFLPWIMSTRGILSIGLLMIFIFLFYVFFRAHLKGQLDWKDLIVRPNSNKVSMTKILQMVGGIVATWIMIKTTMSPEGLSWELFTAYLAYVGSVDAYSKYVATRYEGPNSNSSGGYGGYSHGRQSPYRSSQSQPQYDDDGIDFDGSSSKDSRTGAAKAP